MEVSTNPPSSCRAIEFTRCMLNIHVERTPVSGIPDGLPIGENLQLTLGLADSGIGHLVESLVLGGEEGTSVSIKTSAPANETKICGFDGPVCSRSVGPWKVPGQLVSGNQLGMNSNRVEEALQSAQTLSSAEPSTASNGTNMVQDSGDDPMNVDSPASPPPEHEAEEEIADRICYSSQRGQLWDTVEVDEHTLQFLVTVKSLEQSKEVYQLCPREKLERATHLKEVGTRCFQRGNIDLAFNKYSRSLKYCICIDKDSEGDISTEINRLQSQCYFNMAACHMQKENYSAVIYCCTQGLLVDQFNVKGLFRRAQALNKLGHHTEAAEDLKEASAIEPQNKAILTHLKAANEAIKKEDSTMAHAMSKMFV